MRVVCVKFCKKYFRKIQFLSVDRRRACGNVGKLSVLGEAFPGLRGNPRLVADFLVLLELFELPRLLRPVAFFNGGIESVVVEMGNGETMKLLVPHGALRSASRTGFNIGWRSVAAGYGTGFPWHD